MQSLKEKLSGVPKNPGVYQFLNKTGEVIYVGKAKNLKSRLSQYFQGHDDRPQIPFLLAEATDFNYTIVNNEIESAFLENTLIKQYMPKYNIDLRDDKNYAFITIDFNFEIPQIGYARKIQTEGLGLRAKGIGKNKATPYTLTPIRYFGPYSSTYKIKQTLNLVRRIFPYCAAEKVGNRPCFYYYMHRCPGVCIGKISLDEYKTGTLEKIIKFLQGDISAISKSTRQEMVTAAKNKKFETAARLRNQLQALEILSERQNVILPKKVDWDLISIGTSDGYGAINLFKIRGGKLFDKENFVYELPATELQQENTTENYRTDVIQRFLEQYYLETSSAPTRVYTQLPAKDPELVEHILSSRFGKKAQVLNPQKGQISKLVDLGKTNAEEYLKNWLASQAGHLDKINNALSQLKEVLNLKNFPSRIECYDISNTQGTNPVGSMVVFKDGLPAKSEYRKFKIQGKKTPDDFAMMKEMLTRRMARSNQRISKSANQQAQWPLPDLIVIDGGKDQLGVAVETINNSQLTINVIGLAKRIEEIFLPGKPDPIILEHNQPALQLLQRLRDEAHRFGITFHRKLRSKQAIRSALDDIPGIGPKTKKLLKQKFGTVANIRKTPMKDLEEAVGQRIAQLIQQSL